MDEQLIKLIELCLIDGVISDKERSVIFKKSEELGISKDECEIILEGMIQKHSKKNTSKETKLKKQKNHIPKTSIKKPSITKTKFKKRKGKRK